MGCAQSDEPSTERVLANANGRHFVIDEIASARNPLAVGGAVDVSTAFRRHRHSASSNGRASFGESDEFDASRRAHSLWARDLAQQHRTGSIRRNTNPSASVTDAPSGRTPRTYDARAPLTPASAAAEPHPPPAFRGHPHRFPPWPVPTPTGSSREASAYVLPTTRSPAAALRDSHRTIAWSPLAPAEAISPAAMPAPHEELGPVGTPPLHIGNAGNSLSFADASLRFVAVDRATGR
uniref:Uncharacterized protein n=1 Tax=Neobodo designis TaxID=312471 RepID=A0A7S1MDV5_NEODS|mmetsp:Transcript_3851/g.12189  ORF Transcript_3851/g.12189 Transcript_3851/m.12189 type:complete len:237 (+) Transcript_3851:39-749(+)